MDYKKLIERGHNWRNNDFRQETNVPRNIISEMSAAIQALLEERDAAVEDLAKRPHPSTCKYGEHCDYISVITGRPDCYSCDEWEWHGPRPKKES